MMIRQVIHGTSLEGSPKASFDKTRTLLSQQLFCAVSRPKWYYSRKLNKSLNAWVRKLVSKHD